MRLSNWNCLKLFFLKKRSSLYLLIDCDSNVFLNVCVILNVYVTFIFTQRFACQQLK
jgi:hypothetical protein